MAGDAKKKVLSEDAYMQALQDILRHYYFPPNDVNHTPNISPSPSAQLQAFQNTHTTPDTASFEALLRVEEERAEQMLKKYFPDRLAALKAAADDEADRFVSNQTQPLALQPTAHRTPTEHQKKKQKKESQAVTGTIHKANKDKQIKRLLKSPAVRKLLRNQSKAKNAK